ncbi:choice-of-anchor B family protein [Candidatus Palauibacter sp.]|uniref:choice-of-anchor B family protein n=1 Tax=Candidatus Palauibacter sp. TaxID=3101350 RepID=UPI003B595CBE
MIRSCASVPLRRAIPVLLVSVALGACEEDATGPVTPDPVTPPAPAPPPPPPPPPPPAAEETPCVDGRAGLFPCAGVDLVSRVSLDDLKPGGTAAGVKDIWGWTDPETRVEYALVGRVDGLSIVDLSNPVAPRPIAFLASHTGSSGWRDMKVYADHVYVVADYNGEHGVQFLDLTRLSGLTEFTELQPDGRYTRVSEVHNLAINEETGFAYAVGSGGGGDTCGGGLHMIDLSDPKNPIFVGCYAAEGTGFRGTGYTHDVQCVVYRGPDAEHEGREICVGSNETAIAVSDVTDKANPTTLSTASYADYGYVHQGWLSEDHRYFYQNDEVDELNNLVSRTRLLVWDLADLDDPILAGEHLGPTGAIDHNLYVHGEMIYHSNYSFGVRILDISDRESPVEAGYFDTVPAHDNLDFSGSWSNYPYFESGLFVATSRDEGLFVLRLQQQPQDRPPSPAQSCLPSRTDQNAGRPPVP